MINMGVTDTTDRDLNAARRAADMYSTLPRSSIDLLMTGYMQVTR
jgi:hypothetical protein